MFKLIIKLLPRRVDKIIVILKSAIFVKYNIQTNFY